MNSLPEAVQDLQRNWHGNGWTTMTAVIMKVKQAQDTARQWINWEASELPGSAGAFFATTTNWLPEAVT